jgi:hypothetical protein
MGDTITIGMQYPLPENIPHLSSPGIGIASQGGSGNSNMRPGVAGGSQCVNPVEKSSVLNRETSVDELEDKAKVEYKADDKASDSISPRPAKAGIPDRR